MKKSKLKKLIERVRRFIDEGFDKEESDKEKILNSLKKMKKRERKIKNKLEKEIDEKEVEKLLKELAVIKKLREKAKKLLRSG